MTRSLPTRLVFTTILSAALFAPATVRAQTFEAPSAEPSGAVYDASIVAAFRKLSIVNPMPQLLAAAEIGAPEITTEQRDSIAAHNAVYQREADAAWTALTREIQAQPASFKAVDMVPRINATYDAVLNILSRESAAARAILTADQVKELPKQVASTLAAAVADQH